jgi:hypothetical protein
MRIEGNESRYDMELKNDDFEIQVDRHEEEMNQKANLRKA